MSERMTDDEMSRLGRLEYSKFSNRDKATLWQEADRARAEEARLLRESAALAESRGRLQQTIDKQTITIKTLADAMERHGFACRVAEPATPCFCVWCESRTALRLAGRLP